MTKGVQRVRSSMTTGVGGVDAPNAEVQERSILDRDLPPVEVPKTPPAKSIAGAGATLMYAGSRTSEASRIVAGSLARVAALSGLDGRFRLGFVAHQLRALLPEDTATLVGPSRRHRIQDALEQCAWLPDLDLGKLARELASEGSLRIVARLDDAHSLASTDARGVVSISEAALKAQPALLDAALLGALLRSAILRAEPRSEKASSDPWKHEQRRLRAEWAVDLLMKELAPSLGVRLEVDDPLKRVSGALYYPGAGNDAATLLATSALCPNITRLRAVDPSLRYSGSEREFQHRFPKRLEVELHAADASTFHGEASVVLLRRPGSNDSLMGRPEFLSGLIAELPVGGVILGSVSKYHPLLLHLPLETAGLISRGVAGRNGEHFQILEKVRAVDRSRLSSLFEIDRAIEWARVRLTAGTPLRSMQPSSDPGTRFEEPLLENATSLSATDDWRPFFTMLIDRIEAEEEPLRRIALERLRSVHADGRQDEPSLDAKALKLGRAKAGKAIELPPVALPAQEIAELVFAAKGMGGFTKAAYASIEAQTIEPPPMPAADWIEARLRELTPEAKIEGGRGSNWKVSGLPEISTGGTFRSGWTSAPTRKAALELAWRQFGLLEDGGKCLVFNAMTADERAVRWDGEQWIAVNLHEPSPFAEPQIFRGE